MVINLEQFGFIFDTVLTIIITSVVSWSAFTIKRYVRRQKALGDGEEAIICLLLIYAYERYVVRHEPLSIAVKQRLMALYEALHEIDGNGIMRDIWKAIEAIEPVLVSNQTGLLE